MHCDPCKLIAVLKIDMYCTAWLRKAVPAGRFDGISEIKIISCFIGWINVLLPLLSDCFHWMYHNLLKVSAQDAFRNLQIYKHSWHMDSIHLKNTPLSNPLQLCKYVN